MFNSKNLSIVAIALWIVTVAIIGTMMIKGNTVASDDARVAIQLTKSDKNIITTEMHSFLNTIRLINLAVSENRLGDVSKLAQHNGMQEVELVPPNVLVKLPMEFKQLGFAVHKQFDALSEKAKTGVTATEVNQALGEIIASCLGCHSSYQIVVEGK